MLSILRGGPKLLMLQGECGKISKWLEEHFDVVEYSYRDAMNEAGGDHTILFIRCVGDSREPRIFVTRHVPDEILARAISLGAGKFIERAQSLPRVILFRIFGDYRTVMKQIENDYGAVQGKLRHLMRSSPSHGVAVCFTDKPLNRPLRLKDMHEDILYIDKPYEELFNHLHGRAMTLFNEGFGHRDWNAFEIRVYDSYARYELHVSRLMMVLESLEVGMILGEGWGKDYAHVLMPVGVYCVRLFTFHDSRAIKKILMALEYLDSGERFVDFDLYFKKKKISWTGFADRKSHKRSEIGVAFREEVLKNLDPVQLDRVMDLERRTLEARNQRDYR